MRDFYEFIKQERRFLTWWLALTSAALLITWCMEVLGIFRMIPAFRGIFY